MPSSEPRYGQRDGLNKPVERPSVEGVFKPVEPIRHQRKPNTVLTNCISYVVILILVGPLLVWGYRWAFGVL